MARFANFLFALLASASFALANPYTRPAFVGSVAATRATQRIRPQFTKVSDIEILEAEEAAAFDAHDCSDPGIEAAAEERAVMMAYEIVKAKKEEAKEKREKATKDEHHEQAKSAEELALLMEHAVDDLQKSIGEKVETKTKFEEDEVAEIAVQMLEKAAAAVAAKRYVAEEKLSAAHKATVAAIQQREIDEALAYEAIHDAEAAEARARSVETFGADADIVERRRDIAVSHAAHHLEDDARHMLHLDDAEIRRDKAQEKSITDFLDQLSQNENELKATLKELRVLINEKAMEGQKK